MFYKPDVLYLSISYQMFRPSFHFLPECFLLIELTLGIFLNSYFCWHYQIEDPFLWLIQEQNITS